MRYSSGIPAVGTNIVSTTSSLKQDLECGRKSMCCICKYRYVSTEESFWPVEVKERHTCSPGVKVMCSQRDLSLIGVGWERVYAEGHYLSERLPPGYVCQF